ncbi:MAG: protein-L-isoaspartate O-methyltransferase [Bacteriovorax sp. MedPE-SWde]|nr:MAG: protein-L-isoaspartate O-methyltransferase [Bacteriovorax sp. MedPE-SWde]
MDKFFTFILALLLGVAPLAAYAENYGDMKMEREKMVRDIVSYGEFENSSVLDAMRDIPRENFVPAPLKSYSYSDGPLPIGSGQTISQPFIVAYMTHLLKLKPYYKVLEIGTGSGYQAAVLSKLVKEVYTIEIVPELGEQAKIPLKPYTNVKVKIGDGYIGWGEYSPFNAILVTAAPNKVPQPLIDQLAEGGTLVAPIGDEGSIQRIVRITKKDGSIYREYLMYVRFVPMTGQAQTTK